MFLPNFKINYIIKAEVIGKYCSGDPVFSDATIIKDDGWTALIESINFEDAYRSSKERKHIRLKCGDIVTLQGEILLGQIND